MWDTVALCQNAQSFVPDPIVRRIESTLHMNDVVLQIESPDPLGSMIARCAVFCQVDCCELNAFDVNAYTMLWWLHEHEQDADGARRQLDLLIERVATLAGPVRIADFCFEWQRGGECAEYLRTWREEFNRALRFGSQVTPPEQRLCEAAGRGKTEFVGEVYRIANESAGAEPSHPWSKVPERRERALCGLSALARLDSSDERIRHEVEYARRVLSEQGLSW